MAAVYSEFTRWQIGTTAALLVLAFVVNTASSSTIRHGSSHDQRAIQKDLSDADHGLNGHNVEYDHEAFLGKERAHEFDLLSPEESVKRLGLIAEKIDSDNDKQITEDEMVTWIKYIQRRYMMEDGKVQWQHYEKADNDLMSWEEYENKTFGSMTEEEYHRDDMVLSYTNMRDRDYRRFKLADVDFDGFMSFSEFVNFLHPEESEHMKEVVIMETIDDLDKNGDGFVSQQEYIRDMWPEAGTGANEPEWLSTEIEHFQRWRDTNKDGKLDRGEVEHWIMPDDYDHAVAESKHLIYEADDDKNGVLSKEEIITHHSTFVGSQATDFGNALKYMHDEF